MGKLTSTQQEPTGESLWLSDSSRCNRRPADPKASIPANPAHPAEDVDEVLFNALLDTCCRLKDCTKWTRRSPNPASSNSVAFASGPETARELCQLDAAAESEAIAYHLRQAYSWPSRSVSCCSLAAAISCLLSGILVKTYGQAGDLEKVLAAWDEMEASGLLGRFIVFISQAKFGQEQRGLANSVTYGCMLDACVKCGNLQKAVEVFRGMRHVAAPGTLGGFLERHTPA